ncbi:MAG: hypothetical protein C4537_00785 [Acholeplasma sp.]|nr:MAG: hypothetical protein C4537_00785 [Acholeplasma sp.]
MVNFMVQPQTLTKADKIQKVQQIYFKISLFLIPISIVLYTIGAIFARAVTATPGFVIYIATYLFYYHIAHFLFGFVSLFYYIHQIRKKVVKMKLYKTLVGIILTPMSAIILYVAILLIALTQCAA